MLPTQDDSLQDLFRYIILDGVKMGDYKSAIEALANAEESLSRAKQLEAKVGEMTDAKLPFGEWASLLMESSDYYDKALDGFRDSAHTFKTLYEQTL